MNCRLLQQLPDVNVMNGWQLNSLSLHFSIKGCQLEAPRCCDLLHAVDHLAMDMGQKLASDLVQYRLMRRITSALHLRMRWHALMDG